MKEEDQEVASSAAHIVKAVLPAEHLAPWLGANNPRSTFAICTMRMMGDGAQLIEDIADSLQEHPGSPLVENILEELKIKDGAGFYAYMAGDLGQLIHDYTPSEGGLRAGQAFAALMALKSGIPTPTKKLSWIDRNIRRKKEEYKLQPEAE